MDTTAIIQALDYEIGVLQKARSIMAGKITALPATKRTMSPEGRKRIAEGQKKRWAKQRKAA